MNGPEIVKVRKALGLRQAHLAGLLGTHAVTVCRWERGHTAPTPWQSALLAQFAAAARRLEAQHDVPRLIAEAGAVPALLLLLTLAEMDAPRRPKIID